MKRASHLGALESRTCSGTSHLAAKNTPNKLGIPHHDLFFNKVVETQARPRLVNFVAQTALLYPGNTLSEQVLQEAVWTLETTLRLSLTQRQQTCLRLDGGFGTDENLDWALQRDYQLIAKSKSGHRAGAWGRQVQHWQELCPDRRWVALAPKQLRFGIPGEVVIQDGRLVELRLLNTHPYAAIMAEALPRLWQ